MVDIMSRHMEEMEVMSRLDILPLYRATVSLQHSKSLTVYQLFNKLGGPIPIQFDLEASHFMLLDSITSIMCNILVISYDSRFCHVIRPRRMYQMSYAFLSSHRSRLKN